ncbi:PABPN1 [Lepeophtheirus salmonis]|uniref:PABPN1 n=1 Tax=Lepeophtheirus salmonis TaxID=72036 RepID=A0A7R8D552_LEPSM|nr:PABPN1 [Lepeophtheirus salmonis]CAF3001500.1 PABPN1 [Lepeophtheirus salmonis]
MKAHFASGEEIDFVASPGDMIQEVSKMAHLYLDMIGEVQVESLCHECHDYLHKIKELDITITLIKKTIKLMKKRGKEKSNETGYGKNTGELNIDATSLTTSDPQLPDSIMESFSKYIMSEDYELNADLLEGGEADMTLDSNDDLETIKARVREMEAEAEKLKRIQSEVDKTDEQRMEVDARSVYVGNVDYGATAEELEQHFHGCGSINRVTILCNKYDGHPKGFAYVEFADKDSVSTAMALDDSLFRGRQIKVMPKRTNKPGISSTHRRPRGARRVFMGATRGTRGGRGAFTAQRRHGYSGRRGFYTPY